MPDARAYLSAIPRRGPWADSASPRVDHLMRMRSTAGLLTISMPARFWCLHAACSSSSRSSNSTRGGRAQIFGAAIRATSWRRYHRRPRTELWGRLAGASERTNSLRITVDECHHTQSRSKSPTRSTLEMSMLSSKSEGDLGCLERSRSAKAGSTGRRPKPGNRERPRGRNSPTGCQWINGSKSDIRVAQCLRFEEVRQGI
jgi:hypothetical protein